MNDYYSTSTSDEGKRRPPREPNLEEYVRMIIDRCKRRDIHFPVFVRRYDQSDERWLNRIGITGKDEK